MYAITGKVVKLYFETLPGRKYNTRNHEIEITNQMTFDQFKREVHSIYRLKKYQVIKTFVKISGDVCCIANEQDLHDNVKAGDVIKFNVRQTNFDNCTNVPLEIPKYFISLMTKRYIGWPRKKSKARYLGSHKR